MTHEIRYNLSYNTTLELAQFIAMLDVDSPTDVFEQLQYHPFLSTSSGERALFIYHAMVELQYSLDPTWKVDYINNSGKRNVDIQATIERDLSIDDQGNYVDVDVVAVDNIRKNLRNVSKDRIIEMSCGFKKLFDAKTNGPYGNDVVGAFEYSRNGINHINKYLARDKTLVSFSN